MGKLTDRALRNLKATGTAYKHTDGDGLYVDVLGSGKRVWRYAFRFNGKQTTVTLGEYPALGLEEARQRHRTARQMVREGKHPDHERQAERERSERERQNTLESVAREWIAEKLKIRTAGYRRQVTSALGRHVFPKLGARSIRGIEPPEVLALVRDVERTAGSAAALHVRIWMGGAFRYGVATGRCARDPVADLRGAIARHKSKHHRTIEARDIPAFTAALESNTACRRIVRLYLWLLLLTFVRPGELIGAKWTEIDWPASLWRIPAERTKGKRNHLVPLSGPVQAKLKELQALAAGSELLFPGEYNPRQAMPLTSAHNVLERLGWIDRLTLHGFRSLASTCLNEMGWRPDVIEAQLAHLEPNSTRAAYNRAKYLPERARMMQAWADFVTKGDNVVPLRAAS